MKVYCISVGNTPKDAPPMTFGVGSTLTVIDTLTDKDLIHNGNPLPGIYYEFEEDKGYAHHSRHFIPLDDISIEELTEVLEEVNV